MTAYRKSLLFRLNILVLAAVLPAMAVIVYHGWKQNKTVVETSRASLLQLAQAVAFQHEGQVTGLNLLLNTLSQVPCVRQGDPVECRRLFAASLARNPFLHDIFLAAPDGRVIGSGTPHPDGDSVAGKKYFREALATGRFSVGEYESGHARWYPPLFFALPILNGPRGDRPVGVLVASLDLDVFAGFCRRLNLPEGSTFNLSDHRGMLLYRFPRHATVVPGSPDRPELRAQVTGPAEEGAFFGVGRDNVRRLLAFQRLRLYPGASPYLYIRLTIPEQSIRRTILRDDRTSLLLLALSLAGALSASYVLGGVIIGRRMKQLVEATKRLGQGDMMVETGIPHDGSEIGQVAASFDEMVGRLRALDDIQLQMQNAQKLESLGVLAGGIAHDFNNLLTAVIGNIDVAMAGVDPANGTVHERLLSANRAALRAADLCRQMLAYAGRGQLAPERADLGEIISSMAPLLESSISKKATLRLSLAQGLPPVSADPGQIRQVIMNLVMNGSEALEGKAGEIVVSTRIRALDRAALDGALIEKGIPGSRYVRLEIRDTGCGMTPETLARVFDPFFSTKFTGRGLGLPAVLGIVKAHRGGIAIESDPAVGTSVTVYLPPTDADVKADAGAPAPGTWHGSGTVLLVDDEAMVRDVGSEILRSLGFEVVEAGDGVEALERFREHAGGFSLVLLDLTMPRMDGEEALKAIRAIAPDVPVLVASGYSEEGTTERFSNRPNLGFIAKPFRVADLEAGIRRLLR
jgi:signal transduction histidine kinase/CheY-like chemotaxis protein